MCEKYEEIYDKIKKETIAYLDNNKIKTLVLGISGGIDSTIVAAIIRDIIDSEKKDIKLIGKVIDINSNQEEMKRAVKVTEAFCDSNEYRNLNIINKIMTDSMLEYNIDSVNVRKGNLKARLRMILLYDIARTFNGLVLSTDNLTEYLLGFWTLHGDVGDLAIIGDLFKSEVYDLTEYIADNIFTYNSERKKHNLLKTAIEVMPTDGLGFSDNDFEQIYPNYVKSMSPREVYSIIDDELISILYNDSWKIEEIKNRVFSTRYKRMNPYTITIH